VSDPVNDWMQAHSTDPVLIAVLVILLLATFGSMALDLLPPRRPRGR
jgi:hypothetical protein